MLYLVLHVVVTEVVAVFEHEIYRRTNAAVFLQILQQKAINRN